MNTKINASVLSFTLVIHFSFEISCNSEPKSEKFLDSDKISDHFWFLNSP